MRKLALCMALCALPVFLSGCEDRDARSWIREVRDTVKTRSVLQHTYDMRVMRAICNLDRTVTDGGLEMHNADWAFCPEGAPPPEPPPDPIPDPWGDHMDENGE